MASLKSFLGGAADILGMTGDALYERQRALVALGVLNPREGRGPGSGVPLTPENVGAVIISALAGQNTSPTDKWIRQLINSPPVNMHDSPLHIPKGMKPESVTFGAAVGALLAGQTTQWPMHGDRELMAIRVTHWQGGQLLWYPTGGFRTEYRAKARGERLPPISLSAELRDVTLQKLISFTRGVFIQLQEDEE
jgi:hypothetical protein